MNATVFREETGKRLSPWSIFHYVARMFTWILQSAYALIPLFYGATRLDSAWIGWMLLPFFLLCIAGTAFLTFINFRYQILENSIQVKKGILFKNEINLAFSRIQSVNVKHPFYFRPLGLVTLKIDGAGSAQKEIHLSALSVDAASQLREEIELARSNLTIEAGLTKDDRASVIHASEGDASQEVEFFSRSAVDLVIHGLTNNHAWIVVGGLLVIYQQIAPQTDSLFVYLGIDFTSAFSNQSIAAIAALLLLSFIVAVGIMAGLSVLGSIFIYFNFTLLRSEKSLTIHRGLLSKHEIHLQKSRVQTIYLRQDWLNRVLGRLNLVYEQISHISGGLGLANVRLIVPSVRLHESPMLIKEIFSLENVSALPFTAISKRYFYKVAMLWSLVYVVVPGIFALSRPDLIAYSTIILLPWTLHMAMLFMIWKRKGLAIEKDFVVIKKGIIGTDYIIFPGHKLQEISLVQTPLMQRRHLATLQFRTASRTTTIPYLDQTFAKFVIGYCLYRVESTNKSWM